MAAPRTVPFRRVDAWASGLPAGRWVRLTIRPGEKGPIAVDAMAVRVRTRLEHRLGPEERLVVMRTAEAEPEIHHALSNAAADVPPEEMVRARFARRKIEEVFEAAKGEVGLAQYEVRSRVGWDHHVTLSMPAPPVPLLRAAARRGGNPRRDGTASARDFHATAARPAARPRTNRRGGNACPSEEGVGADLLLTHGDRGFPAAPAASGYQLIS